MFARHDQVWLTPQGWQRAIDAESAKSAYSRNRGVLALWRQRDWPLIARRADADAVDGEVFLGLALPPDPDSGAKMRIALRAPRADVARVLPAAPLAGVIDAAPVAWQASLAALEADAARRGSTLRVYGSLALQALTGQRYLTAASDIDLLCHPVNSAQLADCFTVLVLHARALPLDGEIVFPSGQAVAWKELAAALQQPDDARVLVKGADTVRLERVSDLLVTLAPAQAVRPARRA